MFDKLLSIMRHNNNSSVRTSTEAQIPRSLNSTKRKIESDKIAKENLQMLNRLQNKVSNYSVERFRKDRLHAEKLLKNISDFPFK